MVPAGGSLRWQSVNLFHHFCPRLILAFGVCRGLSGPAGCPSGRCRPAARAFSWGRTSRFALPLGPFCIAVAARLWRRNMAFLPFWGLRRRHRGAYGIAISCLWRPNAVCPSALRMSAENGSFAGRCRRGAAHAVLGGMVVIKFLHRRAAGRCRCRVCCCPARRGARAPPMVKKPHRKRRNVDFLH